jgi:hypothetical protein
MADEMKIAHDTLSDLRARHSANYDKIRDLKGEVNKHSYDALVAKDAKAKSRLDEVQRELANVEFQQSTLTAAIFEAERRLSEMKARVAAAEQTKAARQRLTLAAELRALGQKLDAGFTGELAHQLFALGTRINRAGSVLPSQQQIQVLGLNALYTQLMGTPWVREFRTLAPNERKSFGQLCDGWANSIEQHANSFLVDVEAA